MVDVLFIPLAGSPKFQAQDTMVPAAVVDASVNCVGLAMQAVSAVNIATGAAFTFTVLPPTRLSEHPFAFVTISLTMCGPPVENACVGFWVVEVLSAPDPGSPKFHAQVVSDGPPFVCERSVNCSSERAQALVPKLKLARGRKPI